MSEKVRIKRSQRAYWEGKGRRILRVPNTVLRKLITSNTLFNLIYVTDMGYYPKAASHYVERKDGSTENIIFYCSGGSGWYETTNGYFLVHPNEFFILPSNQKHVYGANPADPWSIYWIMFSGKFCEDFILKDPFKHCFKPNTILHPQKFLDQYEDMFNALSAGYTINNLLFANVNLWSALLQIVSWKIEKNKKLNDTPVEKIISFMKNNLSKKITINEIARMVSFSPSRVHTLFKLQTGYSPLDYFLHVKIQCACDYLNNTDLRIKEIAALVGYDDQYLFTRIFTKIMGQSPRNYRLTLRV
jgi:AraC-like DNA-binding protein